MTQDPMLDFAAFLASAGLGLTLGANLFRGEVRATKDGVPAESVFVMAEGGDRAPFLGTGTKDREVEVEVTVRGAPDDFNGPRELARAISEAADQATLAGYYSVVCEDAEPEHIRKDHARCHEWAVSFTLSWTA